MTLHQLEIWIAVAKHLSVTKAADELLIKQPAVFQQVKLLEKEYGLKLYKFTAGRGMELTPAGTLLLKHAKLILLQVKTVEKKLISSRKRRLGRGNPRE